MSMSYLLDMATTAPAPQVSRELLDIARDPGLSDTATVSEQVLDKDTTTESASWFHVREAQQLPW